MGTIIKRPATAGSLESNDLLVSVFPSDRDLEIQIASIVYKQFGDQIEQTVRDVCRAFQVQKGKMLIQDMGAVEFAVRARVETAIMRSSKE